MTLQVSGPIKFSDIAGEFGTPPDKNLGAFRVSRTVGQLSNLALDNQTNGTNIEPLIPQSGSIKFSDFYGKRLNIVVDFYSSTVNNTTYRNARFRYDEANDVGITKILPSRTTKGKPTAGDGSKIWIHVNQTIGSLEGNRNYVALKTGTWSSTAVLITHIGTGGKIIGAGGNGGRGGYGTGGNATSGTSALGVEYSTTVVNNGLIFGGRGGGGGGGGSEYKRCGRNQRGCKGGDIFRLRGGGGAGGRGFPAGTGGDGGNDGTSGTVDLNGSPGAGIFGSGSSAGYDGTSGDGGSIESSGGSGSTENNKGDSYPGGSGGPRGYAIIINSGQGIIGGAVSGNSPDGSTVSTSSVGPIA